MDVSCSAAVSSVEEWRDERMHGREVRPVQGEGARWASNSDMDSRCDSGSEYIGWAPALVMDGSYGSSSENLIANRRS
jgi:hypothetical protein